MKYEEIIPHLNKIVKVHLKDNKRKVGWLCIGKELADYSPRKRIREVFLVNVKRGRKIMHSTNDEIIRELESVHESIRIMDIVSIRSSK
jgi:hypothetical protein